MQRPGRSSACLHAAAFCTSALPAIRAGDGRYRCPICSITFAEAEIVSDVALLLFIAEHPSASHLAVVRRGDATRCDGIPWAYRKASQANVVPKPKHAQPKRPRTTTHSEAAPGPSQLPAGGARGSVSRPIKLEDDAEEATARETAAATGPAARVRVPKFESARPLQPVAPPVAPHATPPPTHARTHARRERRLERRRHGRSLGAAARGGPSGRATMWRRLGSSRDSCGGKAAFRVGLRWCRTARWPRLPGCVWLLQECCAVGAACWPQQLGASGSGAQGAAAARAARGSQAHGAAG